MNFTSSFELKIRVISKRVLIISKQFPIDLAIYNRFLTQISVSQAFINGYSLFSPSILCKSVSKFWKPISVETHWMVHGFYLDGCWNRKWVFFCVCNALHILVENLDAVDIHSFSYGIADIQIFFRTIFVIFIIQFTFLLKWAMGNVFFFFNLIHFLDKKHRFYAGSI